MKLMGRRGSTVLVLLGGVAAATVVAAHATSSGLRARTVATGGARLVAAPEVTPKVFRGDVRDLPQVATKLGARPEFNADEPLSTKQPTGRPVLQAPNPTLGQMPSPVQNFPGLSRTDTCTGGQCGGGIPPDTNGEVGPTYYVQAVNTAYGIFDKATGARVAAFTEDALFQGSSTFCNGRGGGDPVVVYDPLANRWILTHLAYSRPFGHGPFYQCIAVSRTGNPVTGGWYLYALRMEGHGGVPTNVFNDYPKFGIWTDCLYFSFNGFTLDENYAGTGFGSISRQDLYHGRTLTWTEGFLAGTNPDAFTMMPANLSAPTAKGLPPAGTPEYFVSESIFGYHWNVRKFIAGPDCGRGGRLSGPAKVSQTNYSLIGGPVVPQPPPAQGPNGLDTLIDRVMQKVQYRKVGRAESLWVVHSVVPTTAFITGPQWAQLNVTRKRVSANPVQQQIYTPDTALFRWMPGIAADHSGNVAVGYSTSSTTSFPSIAYSGRLKGDPLNTLAQAETQLVAGAGSQVNLCGGDICHRWGDYASMSVDPVDSCTFWFSSEYYVDNTGGSTGAWNTRIGSFKFPSCTPVGQPPQCKVPRVTGQTLAKAKKRLVRAHCSAGQIKRKKSPSASRGRVLTQSPRPGTRLDYRGKVALTVGKGH